MIVDPGTFVGIRSPPNAIEPFFIVKVFDKGAAQEGMPDANGHYILSGEQYAEVGYLQKKRWVTARLHVAEVFVTNVALDEDLSMDIYEYQSIFDAALWVVYFTIKFQLFSVNEKCCLDDGSFCWLFYILIVLILKYSVSFLLFSTSKFNLIILCTR